MLHPTAQQSSLSSRLRTFSWIHPQASTGTSTWCSHQCCTESEQARLDPQTIQRRWDWPCVPLIALLVSWSQPTCSSNVSWSRSQAPNFRQCWPRACPLSRSEASCVRTDAEALCSSPSCPHVQPAWFDDSWTWTSSARCLILLWERPLLQYACLRPSGLAWRSRCSADSLLLFE